ncbi:MAG: HTH-type transcriptional regulator CysB [Thiohalomonadaceae bacterium]
MKLQQLRYVWEVAQHGLNISATAESLFTSQPGVSKQIRLLEDELGVQIFARSGKHLTHITPAGRTIVEMAGHILQEANNIKRAAQEYRDEKRGTFAVATTHTQARYWLPLRIAEFMRRYPEVRLQMHQGTPQQIGQMAAQGQVDVAIATESLDSYEDLVMLPLYQWNRSVVVPQGHDLARAGAPLTLEALVGYPIITYVSGFTGRSQLDRAFEARHLRPNVVFTAADADVIKCYVKLGLGVGVVANMAIDPETDSSLVALDARHLFPTSTTRLALRRHTFLRRFTYDFLLLLAPHLTRDRVDAAMNARSQEEVDAMFAKLPLPVM